METSRHPYRKFVFAAAVRAPAGHYAVTSVRNGRSFRLEPHEFELARLFDGERGPAQVVESASRLLARELTPGELEGFANELALAGLLEPGTQQPLPVPPQTDAEAAAAGWLGQRGAAPGPDIAPPSTLAGSLSGSGRMGTVTSLWSVFRGQSQPMFLQFSVRPFLPLGLLLNWALYLGLLVWLLVFLTLGSGFALWVNRFAVGHDVSRLMHPVSFTITALASLWLLDFLGEVARAAAVWRATGVVPPFGIKLGVGFVPFFKAETYGPAEALDRRRRMQIIGTTITSTMTVQVLAIAGWFLLHRMPGVLPPVLLGVAVTAMVWLFILINPLAKRDGYHLLANLFNAADLREQALIKVFGYNKPWMDTRRLSSGVLWTYAVLCILYIAWVAAWLVLYPGRWLERGWGTAGVVVFVAVVALYIYLQVDRLLSQRSNIGGELVIPAPNRLDWIIIGAIVAVALFPYPYEPSGDFVVLPFARADVRAQIAGQVREVLVKEGDPVTPGQVVARLVDDEETAGVATSEADIVRLMAELALVKQGARPEEIELARQEVATAQKRYEFARGEADRQGKAFKQRAVSEQQYQHYLSEAEVDEQQLLEAKRHLDLISGPARPERLDEIKAQIASAQAQLVYHKQQLEYTRLRAPVAGRVVSGTLKFAVGDYMDRGAILARVDETDKLQVEIHLPESDAGEIDIGDRAYAKAWGMPLHSYPGWITEIAPSAQNQQDGDRVIRVTMQVDHIDGVLRPDMTGYAKITGATYPLIVAFTRPVVRFILVELWSWLP
ncbi:MAG: HlyD family efflux transporter periplasmic adaptor subunit [Nevskia sp.]|nr:HlyD family efflux transporter periplasmic adaptor subunit [Nevskia sp.]